MIPRQKKLSDGGPRVWPARIMTNPTWHVSDVSQHKVYRLKCPIRAISPAVFICFIVIKSCGYICMAFSTFLFGTAREYCTYKALYNDGMFLSFMQRKYILLVSNVTPFKIDQNKNQNRSIDKVQIPGNERR